jgi:hypothetical protein
LVSSRAVIQARCPHFWVSGATVRVPSRSASPTQSSGETSGKADAPLGTEPRDSVGHQPEHTGPGCHQARRAGTNGTPTSLREKKFGPWGPSGRFPSSTLFAGDHTSPSSARSPSHSCWPALWTKSSPTDQSQPRQRRALTGSASRRPAGTSAATGYGGRQLPRYVNRQTAAKSLVLPDCPHFHPGNSYRTSACTPEML